MKIARAAAKASRRAHEAQSAWVEAFRAEYGHDDISDALVEAIDYGRSSDSDITADFIDENSSREEAVSSAVKDKGCG